GWEPVTTGGIEKWEEGKVVVGVLVKIKEGQFGDLVQLRTEEGAIRTFGCPAILADRLGAALPGEQLYVACRGKITLKSGQEAWDFAVMRRAKQEALPF